MTTGEAIASSAFIPASLLLQDFGVWPSDLAEFDGGSLMLDRIGVRDVGITETETQTTARFTLVFEDELALSLTGLSGIELVFGGQGTQSEFDIEIDLREPQSARFVDISVALRFSSDLLKPVKQTVSGFELDPARDHVQIGVTGSIIVGSEGIRIEGLDELNLEPCMIGNSGIVIEASSVVLDLSRDSTIPQAAAAGLPLDWMGVFIEQAAIHLPPGLGSLAPSGLSFQSCFIGSGGFTGAVASEWNPGARGAIAGVEFLLRDLAFEFRQNALTRSEITGQISLPFFEAPLDVEIGLNLDGGFSLRLSSQTGISTVTLAGVVEVQIDSLGLQIDEGILTAKISGSLTPLVASPPLDWPTFQVKELSIDSRGQVHLEGGWLDLPEQQSLSFYGFQLEITRLGFGKTDDGGKWIGFSGSLKLVDGLTAGASVDGLRIIWYDDGPPRLTLDGVGVELEVPGVLRLKGFVGYRELPGDVHHFDGRVTVELIALNLEIDALIVIGTRAGNPFFAIYLGVELPAGIPLWATGLGLYGIAGLFALEMEPNKTDQEGWFENPDGSPGWYKRPTEGVTDIINKWDPVAGSLGLGGGVTIGTVADNGFTFSGKFLLVIVLPGPIIMLEGRANILSDRSSVSGADPLLRCLAVLDARAGSFVFGLDAHYRFGSGGELIDIRGSAEVFFSFSNASLWHIYLGREEPRERRIRAQIIQIFEANAYFMLDAQKLALGAWIGYQADWQFGPLRAILEAWMEGKVEASLRPVHFHGEYWIHGRVEVSAFGIGVGLSVDVRLAADVFDPFHLLGELSVGIRTPWPFPDISVTITLEWGPDLDVPAIPEPLQEVAIEHMKVSTKWPLMIEGNRNPGTAPVVPLDCRPRITFARTVHDDAGVGGNSQIPWPGPKYDPQGWERIGNPAANQGPVLVRYALAELALQRWNAPTSAWEDVLPPAYGSWAAMPQIPSGEVVAGSDPPVANTKLWLWSKSGFDDLRASGRAWEEWFTDRFLGYPCIPAVAAREVCCDFEAEPGGTRVYSPWRCSEEPDLVLSWIEPARQTVATPAQSALGLTHALCFPASRQGAAPGDPVLPNQVTLQLPVGVSTVRLVVRDQERVEAIGVDSQGQQYPPVYGGLPNAPTLTIQAAGFERILLRGSSQMCVFRICVEFAPQPEVLAERDRMARLQRDSAAYWSQEDFVLEPDRDYRLRIRTSLEARGEGELAGWRSSPPPVDRYAYFRTEGPPGLANLSIPAALPNVDESTLRDAAGNSVQVDGAPASRPVLKSELNSLAPYVKQTLPPTVPAPGEKPPLPRPVYRGYDTAVEFNENYVELLYRSRGRSLALYLYDNNNRPVGDAEGRLVILPNPWGNTAQLNLEESEETWITTINRRGCGFVDEQTIPHDDTLGSAGLVLNADTVYEGRLVPLLYEGPGEALDGWQVVDEGANEAPSRWEVRRAANTFLFQMNNIWGGSQAGTDPVKPGTMLLRPDHWTDYRFSVTLRNVDDDAIGLVFRYHDANNYYRFSMDRERRYRRLVRVVRGTHTVLAEDDFVYQSDTDYVIAVEAIGPSLRVYQDNDLIFAVTDESLDGGRVGLYCWESRGAAFAYMRVDDFRERAPVVYRYAFTTSRYTNFYHHLHGYNDEPWLLVSGIANNAWTAAVNFAGDPGALPPNDIESRRLDDEMRAYDTLAQEVQRRPLERLEVTRIARGGSVAAFLVESPEPFDWRRTSVSVESAAVSGQMPLTPDAMKLTAIRRGAAQPNDEWIEVLLRDRLNPEGELIERLEPPGVFEDNGLDETLFADRFRQAGGLLFEETFGPNALDHYTIVDQGTQMRPSAWAVSGGRLAQTREVYGGSVIRTAIAAPGTIALTGSSLWEDVIIRSTVHSDDDDAIGIVFRYRDEQNYYRFSMSRSLRYRRLISNVGGTATVLWEDSTPFNRGQSYRVELHVWRDRLVGYLDDALLFSVRDGAVPAGRAGFYCWRNSAAHFEALSVESLESDPILWQPAFANLEGLEVHDEPGAIQGPSLWAAADGTLTQTSNIHVVETTPFRRGTYVVGGSSAWRNVQLSVTLRGDDNDAIGVMFRYVDSGNYYRFSMDGQNQYRRLVRVAAGAVTVLWEDNVRYSTSQNYRVTLRAEGTRVSGYLDGTRLFEVTDATHSAGRAGLYCAANNGAVFSSLLVRDLSRLVGGWTIRDEETVTRRSVWRAGRDSMVQSISTTGGGTYALAGDGQWTDYRIQARLRSDDANAIGLVFRYVDERNFYRFSMDALGRARRLVRVAAGVTTQLASDAVAFAVGQSMAVAVDATGDRLQVRVDGTRIFDVRDATHAAGQFGLYSANNSGARFEEVVVKRPPLEAYALFSDRFLAGDLTGWTVVNDGTTGGPSAWAIDAGAVRQTSGIFTPPDDRNTLSKRGTNLVAGDAVWTDIVLSARLQPGSDDTLGLLFRYTDTNNCYRFSMDRQRGYRRLVRIVGGVFTRLWEDTFAYTTGRAYEITIAAIGQELRGYMDGVLMFAVTDATRPAGRIGLYCWANQDARFSNVRVYPGSRLRRNWLLEDSFTSEVEGRWTFVDQTQGAVRPVWRFAPDELWQTADAFGGNIAAASIEKPGTFAVAGDASWTNYRVTVRWISTDDDGIGLMFRYVDENNYYRFSMDRELRYRRLVKVVGGRATQLWTDRTQYGIGVQYAVTIDAIGSELAGYVDGVELFRVQDGDLASGRIALYAWRNTGARFLEVLVSAADWREHYHFGAERSLPAGTRIRIYSGAKSAAHDADPRLVRRFIAAEGESGRIHFGEGPVTLRLKAGHRRQFLTLYAAQNVRLLRKRDGTGFFAVPMAPPFVAGEYRLTLTYHLDVSAIHPGTPVLSEAGVTSNEVAWIDIPWSDPTELM